MEAGEVLGSGHTAADVLGKNVQDRRGVYHDSHGHFTSDDVTEAYSPEVARHVDAARAHVQVGATQEAADAMAQAAVEGQKVGKPLQRKLIFGLLGLPNAVLRPSKAPGSHEVFQDGKHIGSIERSGSGYKGSHGHEGFRSPTGAALHMLYTKNGYYGSSDNLHRRRGWPWRRHGSSGRGLGQYYQAHIAPHLD